MESQIQESALLLKKLREQYKAFAEFRPLQLGIHKELEAQGVAPMSTLKKVMARHVGDHRYLHKVAAGGARYALDGSEAGVVTEAEQQLAANRIEFRRTQGKQAKKGATTTVITALTEEIIMRANTIKVTVVVTDFASYIKANTLGLPGVPITVLIGTGEQKQKVTATLNAKSFRKAQEAYKALGGAAAVVISGEYDIANAVIRSAGIIVQPKPPKQDMPKESAPAI